MTMTDARPHLSDFDAPKPPDPDDMTSAELLAAGLRRMTLQEYTAACAFRDNGRSAVLSTQQAAEALPMTMLQLEAAVLAVDDTVFELKTKRRRIRSADGVVIGDVASPFFFDADGRDENAWRAIAAAARIDLVRAAKTGTPDEAALQRLCDLRLGEASAMNVADKILFNEVLLRRTIDDARQLVRDLAAALAELQHLARDAR